MPELHHDLAANVVHGFRDLLPAIQLRGAIEAGHVGIALALVADGRGFGDQQAAAGALGVVLGHQGHRNGVGRPVAGERCQHDAVGQLQIAGLGGVEQGGHRRRRRRHVGHSELKTAQSVG